MPSLPLPVSKKYYVEYAFGHGNGSHWWVKAGTRSVVHASHETAVRIARALNLVEDMKNGDL